MACDHLLRFQPLFRRYLWGGRRLATELGKPIGEGHDYAESWEVVDHGADQSIVIAGPLAGSSLHELVEAHGPELLGSQPDPPTSFPLLMKLLDCNRTLSVQVHPDDEQAAKLTPPDLGKTEAWVVLATRRGSKVYAGLREGVTRAQLAAAASTGEVEELLHWFKPKTGDCVFIPAGAVHALGAGLLIAEIQQASDTTYRLFDWNRVDADGQPRPLHISESLETIDFGRGPIMPQQAVKIADDRERLVECDKFVMDRCTTTQPLRLGGDGRFHLLAVIGGAVEVARDPAGRALARGESGLLPAAAGPAEVRPLGNAALLDIYLP
jgi:mannose-6-phosphate isomerase